MCIQAVDQISFQLFNTHKLLTVAEVLHAPVLTPGAAHHMVEMLQLLLQSTGVVVLYI